MEAGAERRRIPLDEFAFVASLRLLLIFDRVVDDDQVEPIPVIMPPTPTARTDPLSDTSTRRQIARPGGRVSQTGSDPTQ